MVVAVGEADVHADIQAAVGAEADAVEAIELLPGDVSQLFAFLILHQISMTGLIFMGVLDRFPQSMTALSFLADALAEEGRTREARALLQRVIALPLDPDWAPEGRDFQRKAAARLKTLETRDR